MVIGSDAIPLGAIPQASPGVLATGSSGLPCRLMCSCAGAALGYERSRGPLQPDARVWAKAIVHRSADRARFGQALCRQSIGEVRGCRDVESNRRASAADACRAEASTLYDCGAMTARRALERRSPEGPQRSVGSAPRQGALDDDRPRGDIELDDHAPIADPKTGLRAALQPSQIGASRVLGELPDRAEHPLLDLRVKSFEILLARRSNSTVHGSAVTNRRVCA